MKEERNTNQPEAEQREELHEAPQQEPNVQPQGLTNRDEVAQILERLGVSESTATTARALLESLEGGKSPGENLVKLIVNALNHDEDLKNAEAAGYLRGRNESIDQALSPVKDQQSTPVHFPVYRKRSFWE